MIDDTTGRVDARGVSAVVALSLGLSFMSAWTTLNHFESGYRSVSGDATHYVAVYEGRPLSEIDVPFRFRVLTPWLARAVPPLPGRASQPETLSADAQTVWRFAVVNALGLAAAASFLFLLAERLGLSSSESLLGAVLFLSSYFPGFLATTPLADAWSYAFLAMGFFALASDRPVLFLASFALGLANKESILLLIPAALLTPAKARSRWTNVALNLAPHGSLRLASFSRLDEHRDPRGVLVSGRLPSSSDCGGAARDTGRNPSFLSLPVDRGPGGWSRVEAGSLLRRWRWLVPVVLVVPFVLVKSVGRTWFTAFPILLPLNLIGLRSLLPASMEARGPRVDRPDRERS